MPITVDTSWLMHTLTFSHTADQSCTSAFTRFNGGLRAGDILDFELDWLKSRGPDVRNPNRQIIHVALNSVKVHRPNPGSGIGSKTFWFTGSLTYN